MHTEFFGTTAMTMSQVVQGSNEQRQSVARHQRVHERTVERTVHVECDHASPLRDGARDEDARVDDGSHPMFIDFDACALHDVVDGDRSVAQA